MVKMVMEYFARAKARVWRKGGKVRELELWRNLLVDQVSLVWQRRNWLRRCLFNLAPRESFVSRCLPQAEDGFGAIVLLAQLFKSSSFILMKLVNDDLMERFKSLIKKCGPEVRLINIFASMCFVEGRPMRGFQEACARKLWMRPLDRYNFGVTFHETTVEKLQDAFRGSEHLRFPYGAPAGQMRQGCITSAVGRTGSSNHHGLGSIDLGKRVEAFGGRMFGRISKSENYHAKGTQNEQELGLFRGHVRYSPSHTPPENFLGKAENNKYPPVGVVWRSSKTVEWGSTHGEDHRGGLYWTPDFLGIPSLGNWFYPPSDDESSEVVSTP
jgi:hypothetical protein